MVRAISFGVPCYCSKFILLAPRAGGSHLTTLPSFCGEPWCLKVYINHTYRRLTYGIQLYLLESTEKSLILRSPAVGIQSLNSMRVPSQRFNCHHSLPIFFGLVVRLHPRLEFRLIYFWTWCYKRQDLGSTGMAKNLI